MFFAVALALSACTPGVQSDPELVALFESGQTFEEFVASATARQELWETNGAEATVPESVIWRMLELEGSYRFLVVAADGCQDSAWNIPFLAALAEIAPDLELRMVRPGEGGQAVMEARPTYDGRAATPTVVILDEAGVEVGCWIERPARQRDFYRDNLKNAERGSDAYREAVRDFLGWYAADRGETMLNEVLEILEAAEAGNGGCEA
jgi:hypothetical protein